MNRIPTPPSPANFVDQHCVLGNVARILDF
jgi:hypothetical protein